ncbi:Histidinol-phosphate aminotransferase, partial [termite gut metagenome]
MPEKIVDCPDNELPIIKLTIPVKPLKKLTRPNIWNLKPYSSARDEYKGAMAFVFLDANENPYNAPNNRYPDPLQQELKAALAKIK